ncbi:hypothetical protein CAOG_04340 [Capsaspora owczarzaki ATCC 30864]|uniref:Transmembrane protein n=1 Tax=Capsaspora owczarzaki (strain ATCC 30864) TaxID=595528 RepID=A0A0D2WR28_CAPO3|nr:hypothetical protein CAOG_04340 [Capsaspora owczarzaki ATCC 30864]KJE93573.1 hypothetical protein CAOG_004340 [Capsaspora owczarzaki ATCC 30864]|eukprot:XP_004348168.1 hypothetical protein CAOG_04340 [Capsaspora owczarzaki ATCC 30864]
MPARVSSERVSQSPARLRFVLTAYHHSLLHSTRIDRKKVGVAVNLNNKMRRRAARNALLGAACLVCCFLLLAASSWTGSSESSNETMQPPHGALTPQQRAVLPAAVRYKSANDVQQAQQREDAALAVARYQAQVYTGGGLALPSTFRIVVAGFVYLLLPCFLVVETKRARNFYYRHGTP